ncbi:MAG: hypothetical protein U0836_06895 [Pirellulales bacterium]
MNGAWGCNTVRPSRGWRQFSLRTLLLVSIGLGSYAGWWADRARRQRLAVAALQAAGFTVIYGEPYVAPSPLKARLRSWFGPDLFETVTEVRYSSDHAFRRRRVGDDELARLRPSLENLPGLERLSLYSHDATSEGFSQLEGLTRLEGLRLVTGRGGVGLGTLGRLPPLKGLGLRGSSLDLSSLKSGWPALSGLSVEYLSHADAELLASRAAGLKTLTLINCRLGEAGIRAVARIPGLEAVHFHERGLGASDEAVKGSELLRTLRPDLAVNLAGWD